MTAQTNSAVKTAVQNTPPDTSLNGMTLGEVVDPKNLAKGDLKAAYTAIDKAYDIQWGKEGIEETQEKLKGLQGKVGEHVYDVLKTALKHCEGKLVIARSYFLALCTQAETHCENKYVQRYKEEKPIGQLIPLWATYKSALAKGLERGIDPAETMDEESDAPKYATAAQYRAAVTKLETEARATGSQAGNERNTSNQTATQLQLVTKGWSPRLSAAMEVMCKELNGLTHEEQDKFAPKILEIGAEVATYAKSANREAMGDTRTDAQKAVGAGSTEELDPGTRAAMQAAIDKETEAKATGRKSRGAKAA